ncbi:MAG: hypothetical protein BM559_00735 [Roseobacter sp. MedPE-SWchi]|nr:MAG: hypothetical protein BM559_00735 [Roseobacter sp. MedPE-SWchi]
MLATEALQGLWILHALWISFGQKYPGGAPLGAGAEPQLNPKLETNRLRLFTRITEKQGASFIVTS